MVLITKLICNIHILTVIFSDNGYFWFPLVRTCIILLTDSEENSNLYHHKLKLTLTSKQNCNSQFQEFETIRTLESPQQPKLHLYLNMQAFAQQ